MGSQAKYSELESKKYSRDRIERKKIAIEKLKDDWEKEIYNIIRIYSLKDGIFHQKLADLVDLDRKSIRPYINSLIDKGMIKEKWIGRNKFYIITQDMIKDPILNSSIFVDAVRSTLLKNDKVVILNEDKFKEHTFSSYQDEEKFKDYVHDFTIYKKYYTPKFEENEQLEKMIFEFSNKIGSLVTYLLIYSMNSNIFNLDHQYTDKEKDTTVNRMIGEGISKLIPHLPSVFKESIDYALDMFPKFNPKLQRQYRKKTPRFIFNQDLNKKLVTAFTNLYPLMSYEFERLLPQNFRLIYGRELRGWESAIEEYKKYLKEHHEKLRKQEQCKHEYEEQPNNYQKCKLCNFVTKSKKSKLIIRG